MVAFRRHWNFQYSFLTFTEMLFVVFHTETLTCIPHILLVSHSDSPYWFDTDALFQLSGQSLRPEHSINVLSPSFKRNRSQSPGQQTTLSAAVMALVPWSASALSFSSAGIHLAGASVKYSDSRAFLLLPSRSNQLPSLTAQPFFTKPHTPLSHSTLSASSIPRIDLGIDRRTVASIFPHK